MSQIIDLFKELEHVNTDLLQILQKKSNKNLEQILNQRMELSERLNQLSKEETELKLDTKDLKEIASRILQQDKELTAYLEREVLKLKGKYARAKMF